MAGKKPEKTETNKNLTIIALVVAFLAGVVIPVIKESVSWYERNNSLAKLTYTSTKFIHGNNLLYITDIINKSEAHAEGIHFKGEFKNCVIKCLRVEANGEIIHNKDIEFCNPKDCTYFPIKRLSSRVGICNIDVGVRAENEVKENIQLSWNNGGHLTIIPKLASEESKEESKKDASYDARKRWLESNNKGIKK